MMVGNAWLWIFCKKLLPFVYYVCTMQLQKVAVLKKLWLKKFDFGLIQHCEMKLELFMWWFKRESMPCVDLCVVMRLMGEVRLREHALYSWFLLCSTSSILWLSFVSLSFMKLFKSRSGNHCKHCGYHRELFLQGYSEETGTREANRSCTTHIWWQLYG